LNIKDFLEPHLNSVKHHTSQHHFKVVRNMYTVNIFYKSNQNDAWIRDDNSFLASQPKGQPKRLKQDFENLDFVRIEKQVNSVNYLFSSDSKLEWWNILFTEMCVTKDSNEILWISQIKKQPLQPSAQAVILQSEILGLVAKEKTQTKLFF